MNDFNVASSHILPKVLLEFTSAAQKLRHWCTENPQSMILARANLTPIAFHLVAELIDRVHSAIAQYSTMDPVTVGHVATKWNSFAGGLQTVVDDYREYKGILDGSWQGVAKKEFDNYMEILNSHLTSGIEAAKQMSGKVSSLCQDLENLDSKINDFLKKIASDIIAFMSNVSNSILLNAAKYAGADIVGTLLSAPTVVGPVAVNEAVLALYCSEVGNEIINQLNSLVHEESTLQNDVEVMLHAIEAKARDLGNATAGLADLPPVGGDIRKPKEWKPVQQH